MKTPSATENTNNNTKNQHPMILINTHISARTLNTNITNPMIKRLGPNK